MCRLSLRFKNETCEDSETASAPRSIPRPRVIVHAESFGPLISNPGDVELMLRRARLAVLSRDLVDSALIEDIDAVDAQVLDSPGHISKNVICVDIAGPNVDNATLIDLPVKPSQLFGLPCKVIIVMLHVFVGNCGKPPTPGL